MLERGTTAAARLLTRLSGKEVRAREVWWLLGLMALGFAIRVGYVLITEGYTLAGDQIEYDEVGRAAAAGDWFHTTWPYGVLHESAARPPGYMLWIGVVYSVFGVSVTKALLIQACIGPIVVFLVWLLARRLFDDGRIAGIAAAVAAVHPNMWQWEGRLYSESLILPISLVTLLLLLTGRPTPKRAAAVGAVMGVGLLVRPSQIFMFVMILAVFWLASGLRRGVVLTAVAVATAALVISPWTIRNYAVTDGFVPLSLQDAAVAGTFNETSAKDPYFPYGWRPIAPRDADILGRTAKRLPEVELRDELQSRAIDYIKDHPTSVIEAFWWNGISRTWEIRRPQRVLDEVPHEGREKGVAAVGLGVFWILLVGAIAALWRLRRARRELVLPILAGALSMSVVFTVAAGSRYRVPFEPIVVILAATSFVALWDRLRARRSGGAPAVAPSP